MKIKRCKSFQHILVVGGILAVFTTSSCKDLLDQDPPSNPSTSQYYQNEKQIRGSITAIYDSFNETAFEFVRVNAFRSDNFWFRQYAEFGYSDNGYVTWPTPIWSNLFNIIYRSNKTINSLSDLDIDNKDQLNAQARFMRGYAYFWLGRLFGKVPIVTKQINRNKSLNKPRSSVSDVYAQVEKDLKFAVEYLPQNLSTQQANKYVAEAILARVYITESGYPVNKNKYSEALPLLEDIIQNGGYELEKKYEDIFSLDGEKNSNEIIFSAVMDSESKGHQHTPRYILDPNGIPVRVTVHSEFKEGGGYPKGDLWKSFEDGDVRRDASLGTTGTNNLGQQMNNINNTKYNYGYVSGIGWTSDFIFVRYANILLLYAEALQATGEASIIQNQWGIINRIRNRAGLNNVSPSNANFEDVLLKERRHEFVWEGVRWFDLVRTNRFVSALKKVRHNDAADYWKYLPIPVREMDIMGDKWENNKGY